MNPTPVILTLAREAALAAGPGAFVKKALMVLGQAYGAARLSYLVPGKEKGEWLFAGAVGIRDTVLHAGPVSIEHNVLGHVIQSRTAVAVADMVADGRFGAPKKLRYTSRSFAVVPVARKGRVCGILCVTEPGAHALNESHLGDLNHAAEVLATGHELLSRLDDARVQLRLEAEQERLATLVKDMKPRFDGWKGLDVAVAMAESSGPLIPTAVTDGEASALFAQCSTGHALRVLPAMAASLPNGAGLLKNLGASLKLLKVSAAGLSVVKTPSGLSISAAGWPTCWHFDAKSKKIKAISGKGVDLGKAGAVAPAVALKWKTGDLLVAVNPSALPGKAGVEKKVLDSLLRHQREPSRKISASVAAECLTDFDAGHLVAVFKNEKK